MLRGLRDAVLGLDKVVARRRAIQARRAVSIAGLATRMDWSVGGLLGRRSRTRPVIPSAVLPATIPPATFTRPDPSPTS
jgi:hypothetical protein